jgi:hypothetical protein
MHRVVGQADYGPRSATSGRLQSPHRRFRSTTFSSMYSANQQSQLVGQSRNSLETSVPRDYAKMLRRGAVEVLRLIYLPEGIDGPIVHFEAAKRRAAGIVG